MFPRVNSNKISLFASSATWIEGEALQQLERVASCSGMAKVAGFPDLHPGMGAPVGAAMLSKGAFYPHLVGSDVGCGMGLFSTDLPVAKARPEKWSRKLHNLEEPWEGDANAWLEERQTHSVGYNRPLGTIGGGNHFAELLRWRKVNDYKAFKELGLDENALVLLVHSGSRGLGEVLLRRHTDRFRDGSLTAGSEEAECYLGQQANAIAWAAANRELIAYRFLDQLGSGYQRVMNLVHNSITPLTSDDSPYFLHRKGAAPSNSGPVVIPGSRGAASYLVMPTGEQDRNLWSLAHGAGRKWCRSECEGRLRQRFSADSLRKTKLGSYVICEDKELLFEEAPQAYKDIETTIGDMLSFGMIRVIASITPILTYKVRER